MKRLIAALIAAAFVVPVYGQQPAPAESKPAAKSTDAPKSGDKSSKKSDKSKHKSKSKSDKKADKAEKAG
jgi:Ni/Co efflux regulator RcnB